MEKMKIILKPKVPVLKIYQFLITSDVYIFNRGANVPLNNFFLGYHNWWKQNTNYIFDDDDDEITDKLHNWWREIWTDYIIDEGKIQIN